MQLLILQKRAHRAGAQVSLCRLLTCGVLAPEAVTVACGDEGWLAGALRAAGIGVRVRAFPSSRALGARLLGGNRAFAADLLRGAPAPSLVVANDHGEGLLARAVARAAGVPWAAILRSSETTPRDLDKYGIRDADAVFAVGPALRERAREALGRPVEAYPEGLLEADFPPPGPIPAALPEAALVVGTPQPDKGWGDLQAALTPDVRPTRWCFTADALPFEAPPGHRFEAIGRGDDYLDRVRAFGLVVHPSQGETFGLAVAEAVAAGVPVLASETGVVPALGLPAALTFPPGDVAALRDRLRALSSAWPPDVSAARRALSDGYRLTTLARPFVDRLAALSLGPSGG